LLLLVGSSVLLYLVDDAWSNKNQAKLKFVGIFYLGLELTSDYIADGIYGIVVF
jgi:hypothetical protein